MLCARAIAIDSLTFLDCFSLRLHQSQRAHLFRSLNIFCRFHSNDRLWTGIDGTATAPNEISAERIFQLDFVLDFIYYT